MSFYAVADLFRRNDSYDSPRIWKDKEIRRLKKIIVEYNDLTKKAETVQSENYFLHVEENFSLKSIRWEIRKYDIKNGSDSTSVGRNIFYLKR